MRRAKGFVLAVLLSVVVFRAMDIPFDLCATLDPGGWLYGLLCKDTAGGGGSGAGME